MTTAKTDEEGRKLLQLLGMPFQARLAEDEDRRGKEVDDRQGEARAALPGPAAQPLPGLRAAAGLHAALRDVPHLLPGAGPEGQLPGVTKSSW